MKRISIRSLLMVAICVLLTACVGIPVPRANPEADSAQSLTALTVCDTTGTNAAMLIFTQRAGLFEKYGLTVNVEVMSGVPEGMAALITGEVDLCHTGGASAINAALAGEELSIIAGMVNSPFFVIVAHPEIQTIDEIKGTVIASGTPGSGSDIFLRLALDSLDLLDEVELISVGRSADRLAAMTTREILAGVVSAPEVINAQKLGFHVILDGAKMDIPYQTTVIVTKQSSLANNRQTMVHFMQALLEGRATMKKDRAGAIGVLAEILRLDLEEDATALDTVYDLLVLGYWAQPPYPTFEGIQLLINEGRQDNPGAVDLTVDDIIDISIVQELEESGFLDALEAGEVGE
ncbi:MAG: ABC transporter substrate-binding protein [Caldilineaceae bacterium]|nr:ABC transporter substrate-binding protein [Caldilineaceae bacterium]